MIAVIDTNILVSALWTPSGNASLVLSHVLAGFIKPCHDYRIIEEYFDVLNRPRFQFSPILVSNLLDTIVRDGLSVIPAPLPDSGVSDPDDLPFFEVAKFCNAPLVTGNIDDFPQDPLVMSLSDFCSKYLV